MLCDLSFLEEGSPWPPEGELDRLEKYERNKLLFEGRHDEVFREQFRRIERVIGNFNDIIAYPLALNFQKIISLKTADLLFGEPPVISVEGLAIDPGALAETAYEAAVDVSRYGTGLFQLRREGGKVKTAVTPPAMWFPVVDEHNIKNIRLHVMAYPSVRDGKKTLNAAVHEPGFVNRRRFLLDNGRIKKEIGGGVRQRTGLRGFAVIPVNNVSTSESVYGLDDYVDLDGIVSEIEVRTAQIARILDKHSNPSMTGPSSALSRDEAGNWVFAGGNYIPNDTLDLNTSADIKYITWDAHLDSNFRQIEMLLNMLYMISECGATLLGASKSEGSAQSGTALKLRMMSPLAKVNRVKLKFDDAIRGIAAEMTGRNRDSISIEWQDGLPIDDVKEI